MSTSLAISVDLSSTTYSVTESDEVVNVSLELIGAAEREVTVLIETQDGTATGSQRGSGGGGKH